MKMALIYDPLNDIDLFAWGLSFDHDIYEMAISPKRAVKIIPPTKQRLLRIKTPSLEIRREERGRGEVNRLKGL